MKKYKRKRRSTLSTPRPLRTGGVAGGRRRKTPRPPRSRTPKKISRTAFKKLVESMKPGDRAQLINKQLPAGTVTKKYKKRKRVPQAVNATYSKKTQTMAQNPGKRIAKPKSIDFSDVHKELKRRQQLPKTYKFGTVTVVPVPPMPGGTGRIPKADPFMETETVSGAGVPTAGGLIGKVQHAKHIHSGKPTSSTLKRLAKNNGTHKAVMFDTKFTNLGNSQYNHSHGFNCKSFWIPPAASFVNQSDIEREIGSTALGIIRSADTKESFYASVLNVKQSFVIHNQNVSLPMKVKIHWVRMDDRKTGLNPVERLGKSLFHLNLASSDDATSLREKVPASYQFSNLVNIDNRSSEIHKAYEVQTSTKLNPFVSSPAFKTQFTHIRTVSKVLQPGDTWSVHHTHHCGSGISLEDLRSITGSADSGTTIGALQPVSFLPVIETHGFTVEGVRIGPIGGQSNLTYLGTAPGWYKAELKKEITYVKSAHEVSDLTDSVSARSKCHLRVFTKDDNYLSGLNEAFALPNDIGDDQQGIEGKWYIPVVRDHEISHASPRHVAADNSAGN